ncbi:MAG: hypothetical protein PWP64_988, partial [Candidatus Cloacimonadota bacterium]|nr:hypothetical protein [Candidatus Cloacimonadota bacterium]
PLPVAKAHRNSSYSITCLHRILRVVIVGIVMLSKMPSLWNSQGIGNRLGLGEESRADHGHKYDRRGISELATPNLDPSLG